jgi:hypothetical protein
MEKVKREIPSVSIQSYKLYKPGILISEVSYFFDYRSRYTDKFSNCDENRADGIWDWRGTTSGPDGPYRAELLYTCPLPA